MHSSFIQKVSPRSVSRLRTCLLSISAMLLLPAAYRSAHAADEEPSKDLKHLGIRSGIARVPFDGGRSTLDSTCSAHLDTVMKNGEGELYARGVFIEHLWIALKRKNETRHSTVYYPELRKGDLVPVYSYIYELTNIVPWDGPPKDGNHRIDLKMLPKDKVPAGLSLGKDPMLVPLEGGSVFRLYLVKATAIELPPDKAPSGKDKPVAKLELSYHPLESKTATHYTASVMPGDSLLLGGHGFKVRNVVPKDKKTKAIGWVEFAPEPIPKAELVRDQVKFVEPVLASPPK